MITTIIPWGIEGKIITIEIDSSKSLPGIDIIGLPDNTVKEAKDRIRSAFRSCNIEIPPNRYIINLSPSDIKKSGSGYDIPISVALLEHIYKPSHIDTKGCIFIGELGLDGSIKSIPGVLSVVLYAIKKGYKKVYVPYGSIHEVQHIGGIEIYPIASLHILYNHLIKNHSIDKVSVLPIQAIGQQSDIYIDDIIGHDNIKRALIIAAVGGHNILLIGPPGTGKSMLAKATASILPPMTTSEIMSVNQIYSLSGQHPGYFITQRPFRSIHHTASKISLVGGGSRLLPGELSHAHCGVLFLDELPEFPRDVLDTLRQPLEDKYVHISRAQGAVTFPANCMVVAAMNPCVCGYYKDTEKTCTCSLQAVKKYQSRISGPLLDRFDMIVEVGRQDIENTSTRQCIDYSNIVQLAWDIQTSRYNDCHITMNSQLGSRQLKQFAELTSDCREIMAIAIKKLSLSHRAIHKILRVGRTIADIDGSHDIQKKHLLEALQYRQKEFFVSQ